MRTLVIAAEYPWPVNSGSRIRLSSTLRGLRSCGSIELFSVVSDKRADFAPPPPDLGIERFARVAIDDGPQNPVRFVQSLARVQTPFELPIRAGERVLGSLRSFIQGSYDLVWCFRVRAWVLAREPAFAPVVVDLDDLEDEKIRARISIPRDLPGPTGAIRKVASRLLWAEEIRRWRHLHHEIARRSTMTVVCSDLDAQRAGLHGVRVLPNGYEQPEVPPGGHAKASLPPPHPTVLFQGTLRYPPNADAARFLVRDVVPKLKCLVDDVRVRLVGLPAPDLKALDDPPTVSIVGQVPDIDDELAVADVVIVPLRFGSGTRVKILEAFAHQVPVVSTTLGAEGLDAENGVHLLIADDADGLARACSDLLGQPALRAKLVANARSLFESRYEASIIDAEVARIALDAVGSSGERS